MTWVGTGPQTAWLFTKGNESIRLEVHADRNVVRLLVKGPGRKRAAHEFPDMTALVSYQSSYEQQLAAQGFSLERFTSERRRWAR